MVKTTLLSVPAQHIPALQAVVKERVRQDAKWGGPTHDDQHDMFDWQKFIRERVRNLTDDIPTAELRNELVEIAALAVAAIESVDRKTGG